MFLCSLSGEQQWSSKDTARVCQRGPGSGRIESHRRYTYTVNGYNGEATLNCASAFPNHERYRKPAFFFPWSWTAALSRKFQVWTFFSDLMLQCETTYTCDARQAYNIKLLSTLKLRVFDFFWVTNQPTNRQQNGDNGITGRYRHHSQPSSTW